MTKERNKFSPFVCNFIKNLEKYKFCSLLFQYNNFNKRIIYYMSSIIKKYLDYNGLKYFIEKIKKGIPFILKPTLTNQYDLGQTDKQWKNIYGENVYQNQKQVVDTIKMNGSTTALTNNNGTVVIPTVAGPQGPTGEQGPVGPAAGFGAPTATTTIIADNADPTVSVTASGSNTDKVFAFMFGLPRGYQGATGLQGDQGVQGATGPRGVQGKTGGAGFIASVDRQNFTKADWETYGVVGHQENWSNTTIPSGMIDGDLFVITGCATDTGDGYQLVYKYDPTFRPTNTTLRGTCISSHVIARHAQLSTTNAGTNISITNNKINAEGYSYNAAKEAFAEGIRNYATGLYSHSEGDGVDSPGRSSHAEGEVTHSEGQASHAEGNGTVAHGLAAHSEGTGTFADGENSHAEGLKSTASGENSHAEGKGLELPESTSFTCTVLTDEQKEAIKYEYGIDFTYCDTDDNINDDYGSQGWIYSDANFTNLVGKMSVSKYIEGTSIDGATDCPDGDYFNLETGTLTNGTTYYWKRTCGAMGSASHTEGDRTTASGDNSHAEGSETSANGAYSHAEGNYSVAAGGTSHAEGYYTIASGDYSHAEGNVTTASGIKSHAEGNVTTASGSVSHAEGGSTIASGNFSHAEGLATIANNKSEHAQGEYNKSTQAQTGATGTAANAYSIFSVGIGTSDADRRNAIEIHKNGDIFINGTDGAAAGNINYSKSFQTAFNNISVTATIAQNIASTANDMISHINMIKHTENTSVKTQNMLWRTSNENMYEERCIYTYYTGSYTSINLYLPDDDKTTISNGNFSTFVNPTSMQAFKNKFQYYILHNGTGNTITLTLQSRKKSITTKDNVTSFTLKPSSIIEFSAVLFNSFGYMITYTQYS